MSANVLPRGTKIEMGQSFEIKVSKGSASILITFLFYLPVLFVRLTCIWVGEIHRKE